MKINFLTYCPAKDGGSRIIAQYAKQLSEFGHDVQIYSLGRNWIKPRHQLHLLKQKKWQLRTQINTQFYDDAGLQLTTFDNRHSLSADDFREADVTIATWWETIEWTKGLPKHCAVIHLVQDDEAAFSYVDQTLAEKAYRHPLHHIAVSKWLQQLMIQKYDHNHCDLVENTVDQKQFSFQPRDKQKQPTVGFLYTDTVRKNCGLAIRACQKLREQNPNIKVISFGSKTPVEELPLPDWVEYHQTPVQSALQKLYASCDAWLLTSDSEGFGLPILEAMACGTPVVSTFAGAAPQLISSDNGALVASTTDDVLEGVKSILNLPNHRWRDMSSHAAKKASARSLYDATKELETILEKLTVTQRREVEV